MARDFYTPSEVAQILRVSQRSILGLLDAGELEAERTKGFWRRLFGG